MRQVNVGEGVVGEGVVGEGVVGEGVVGEGVVGEGVGRKSSQGDGGRGIWCAAPAFNSCGKKVGRCLATVPLVFAGQ